MLIPEIALQGPAFRPALSFNLNTRTMKKGRIIMIAAALLPMLLFVFPLWKITLEAPQYPTPLGMYIFINDLPAKILV